MAKKAEAAKASSHELEQGKVCAILSYLLVGIIWYFADEKMKKNSYVKFHAKQGLVLLIFSIAIWIVERILFSMFFNPFSWGAWGAIGLLGTIFWIVGLAELVLVIIGIVNAANGNQKPLPIIGGFASKLNF